MWGMWLAHLGVAAFAFGVSMVNTYGIERDVKMEFGDTVEVAGYVFTYRGVRDVQGPNYAAAQGLVEVTRDGKPVATMQPGKAHLPRAAEPDDRGRDRHRLHARPVCLARRAGRRQHAWIVRVYFKPFIDWIWGGCVLMALGGVLAATDRRYRATSRERERDRPMRRRQRRAAS